jgi:tetratricopeptide (TPR) repeat protein
VPARSYGEAFRRAAFQARRTAWRARRERCATESSIALLLDRPEPERARVVRSSPALRTYALVGELLAASARSWYDDAKAGEELAQLARLVADHLSTRHYGRASLEDLRATAWGFVANTRRIRTDYRGAAEAFGWAEEHGRHGSGDPAEVATWTGLRSTWLRDCGELGLARDHLDHAIALHRHTGSRHLEARSLISLSILERQAGNPDLAMSLLERAGRDLEPGREPRLTMAVSKNRALTSAELGDRSSLERALGDLDPHRELAHLDRLRTIWARGVLLERLDRPEGTEAAFKAARRGFLRAQIPGDVALLDLDLGRLYLTMGRREEARRSASAAFPTFAARGPQRDLLRALTLFRQAGGLA